MLLHYGTLTDCLALAGRYFMDGHTRMNQDLFQSVGEVHILGYNGTSLRVSNHDLPCLQYLAGRRECQS